MAVLVLVAARASILADPPWEDASEGGSGVVSEAEAREAFLGMVAVASAQTPGAMERLCQMAADNCNGLSGSIVAHPESAPGEHAPTPEVLCSHRLHEHGERLLVVEGEDGFGRPYVSQLVFRERGDRVVLEREPGFWLGIVHHGSGEYTGAASWTAMHHPQADVQTGADADDLMKRARGPCMAR